MESFGLEMDDLFDDRPVDQDMNDFETVEEDGNHENRDAEDVNDTTTQDGKIESFRLYLKHAAVFAADP